MTVSTIANWEPRPTVESMKKKKIDQIVGNGICESASGYTTNARPGPVHNPQKTFIISKALLIELEKEMTNQSLPLAKSTDFMEFLLG